MNTTLHLVQKDFRFLRQKIALWVLVMATKLGLGFWLAGAGAMDKETMGALQAAVVVLGVVEVALTVVLTVILVQEDSVCGASAGWRTRPISSGRLLRAKAASAGVWLVGLPVVVALPWWWWCGFTAAQVLGAALEVVALQVLLVTVGQVAASVTDSLGRALVWGLVGAAVTMPIASAWTWLLGAKSLAGPGTNWLLLLVLVALGVVAVIWQYLTLRVAVARGLIVGGMLLAPPLTLALAALCVGNAPAGSQNGKGGEAMAGANIDVVWESARLERRSPDRGAGKQNSAPAVGDAAVRGSQLLEFDYVIKGVPAGQWVTGVQAHHRLTLADGDTAVVGRSGIRGENQGVLAAEFAAGAASFKAITPEGRETMVVSYTTVEPEMLPRIMAEPVALETRLLMNLVKPRRLVALPMVPGGWHASEGRGLRVGELDLQTGTVVVLESEPLGMLAAAWREWRRRPARDNFLLVVSDRSGATAVAVRGSPSVAVGGVELRRREFSLPRTFAGPTAGAWLTAVELEPAGAVERTVRVPQLRVH